MKKSLALIASAAMAFSLFSSVAFAADASTTTSTTSTLTTEDMMKDLGFTGTDHDYLDRASAAVSILKGLGIEVDNSATLPFVDVNASDAWAPYIATAAKLGIVHGNDATHYAPFDKISQQDYVIELVLAYAAKTGTKVDTTATADVNASGYAKAYIAAAQKLGLVDASDDWTGTASYDWMVKGAYATKQAVAAAQAPAKVSVSSAKAVGVQKVEVSLDKAVDTTKATFTLKRGTATIDLDASKTTWSDDKKTATLVLNGTRITDGDYTVTLGGLDSAEIDQASASFKGEAETVSKISFVSAGDTLAYASKVRVNLKAENQYGEEASFSAANYTVVADPMYNSTLKKNSDGQLYVELKTNLGSSVTQGVTMIPLYVYYNDNHVTAQKTFKLGFAPFVSKMEVSDVKYDNGKDALSAVGDTATAQISLYDQYGNPVTISGAGAQTFNTNLVPYSTNITPTVADLDNDDEYEVRVALNAKEEKASTYSLSIYSGSSSGTIQFQVASSKVATKVEFDSFNGTLAVGDTNKYVNLIAYDANGNQLSAQDIADNAARIKLNINGGTLGNSGNVITVGPHKGQVQIATVTNPAKSYVFLTASIQTTGASSFDTYQIPIADERIPDHIVVDTASKAKAVDGGTSDFKVIVKDQYGDTFGNHTYGGTVQYAVYYHLVDPASLVSVTGGPSTVSGTDVNGRFAGTGFDAINDGMTFNTVAGVVGTAKMSFTIQKSTDSGSTWADVSSPVTVSIEGIPYSSDLTYSMEDIGSLYAAEDSGVFASGYTFTPSTEHVAKTLSVVVKDTAGNEVAYPDHILSVSTDKPTVIDAAAAGNKGYVLGNKAGTATVTAVVYKANGETTLLSSSVTTKSDLVVVDSITANGDKQVAPGSVVVGNNINTSSYMDLDVKDQYGIEYKTTDITGYDNLLGVRYTVSDVKDCTVSINSTTGAISAFSDTGTAGTYQFVVTATAPNGKSASTVIWN